MAGLTCDDRSARTVLLTISILSLGLTLSSCGPRSAAEEYKPLKAHAPLSDSEFRDLIVGRLGSDDALSDAQLRVRARSKHREVELAGTVESDALHQRALDLVRSVDPEILLIDDIVVDARS